jgi:tricarballylate dehydrogenase
MNLLRRANDSHDQSDLSRVFDVLVIGGGNAGLCAAMEAREAGGKVLLLESAPKVFRGGNSRHTRNIRYSHERGNEYLTGPYTEEEFWEDLQRVTEGNTNPKLARQTIRESKNIGIWMEKHGCVFQPAMRGTLHLARTNAFFLGGGKALMNAYYLTAERLGVETIYGAEAQNLQITDAKFISADFVSGGICKRVRARSVVVTAGGFQANLDLLKEAWGKAADNFLIRGTSYDKGLMLQVLLDNKIKPVGDPRQCHAVAIDARAPKFDGGIVTRLDCIPFGIVVDIASRRFYDEGEDLWPKRYAIWGRLVAQQAEQTAYSVFDSKSLELFIPSVYPPIKANSIAELAAKLKLEPSSLEATVNEFNQSTKGGVFDPTILDECRTEGLVPPKSNWARPLETPPFYAYPLRPGITFTYLGVTVNEKAQVIMQNEQPAENIFAAGEIMSGNILGKGYMAGFGMTIGTVFGRIAGKEAMRYVMEDLRERVNHS